MRQAHHQASIATEEDQDKHQNARVVGITTKESKVTRIASMHKVTRVRARRTHVPQPTCHTHVPHPLATARTRAHAHLQVLRAKGSSKADCEEDCLASAGNEELKSGSIPKAGSVESWSERETSSSDELDQFILNRTGLLRSSQGAPLHGQLDASDS